MSTQKASFPPLRGHYDDDCCYDQHSWHYDYMIITMIMIMIVIMIMILILIMIMINYVSIVI